MTLLCGLFLEVFFWRLKYEVILFLSRLLLFSSFLFGLWLLFDIFNYFILNFGLLLLFLFRFFLLFHFNYLLNLFLLFFLFFWWLFLYFNFTAKHQVKLIVVIVWDNFNSLLWLFLDILFLLFLFWLVAFLSFNRLFINRFVLLLVGLSLMHPVVLHYFLFLPLPFLHDFKLVFFFIVWHCVQRPFYRLKL